MGLVQIAGKIHQPPDHGFLLIFPLGFDSFLLIGRELFLFLRQLVMPRNRFHLLLQFFFSWFQIFKQIFELLQHSARSPLKQSQPRLKTDLIQPFLVRFLDLTEQIDQI